MKFHVQPELKSSSAFASTQAGKRSSAALQSTNPKRSISGFLKFIFMPELGRSLGGVGQAWHILVVLVAQLFAMAKLLPSDHPALNIDNASQFKLIGVINIASKNLKFDLQHVPQIVVFFSIIGFLVALFMGIIVSFMQLFTGTAHAQINPNLTDPVGTTLLGDLFNLTGSGLIPVALGGMLKFYSNITLVFGGIILIYLIIQYVADTAQTGQVGGKNFNHVWVPIRLIVAIGMLIPLSGGLNSGQHIVLNLTKWGSDLSSNMWKEFAGYMNITNALNNGNMGGTGGTGGAAGGAGSGGYPLKVRGADEALGKIFEMELCAARNNKSYADYGLGNAIKIERAQSSYSDIMASQNNSAGGQGLLNLGSNKQLVYTKFIYRNEQEPDKTKQNCGSITFPHYSGVDLDLNNVNNSNFVGWGSASHEDYVMRQRFRMYAAARQKIHDMIVNRYFKPGMEGQFLTDDAKKALADDYSKVKDGWTEGWKTVIQKGQEKLTKELDVDLTTEIRKTGWLAAPVWLFRVVQLNAEMQNQALMISGTFDGINYTGESLAVDNFAKVSGNAPIKLEDSSVISGFLGNLGNSVGQWDRATFDQKYQQWQEDRINDPKSAKTAADARELASRGMPGLLGAAASQAASTAQKAREYIDIAVSVLSGWIGCPDAVACVNNFTLRTNNPIVEISVMGQKYFNIGTDAFLTGATLSAVGALPVVGAPFAALSPLFTTIGIALIAAGFFLGFLIPLAPILRFYAGVVGWIMLVLQMVLAVPIIALGHLSTRGEGFAGDMRTAYVSLLGVILRPMLMILGLIVGLIAFTVGMKVFSAMFVPAMSMTFGLAGANLFHAAVVIFIYAFFVYALANSAFKMVDLVPQQAMDWIGAKLANQGTEDDLGQVGRGAQGALLGLVAKSEVVTSAPQKIIAPVAGGTIKGVAGGIKGIGSMLNK